MKEISTGVHRSVIENDLKVSDETYRMKRIKCIVIENNLNILYEMYWMKRMKCIVIENDLNVSDETFTAAFSTDAHHPSQTDFHERGLGAKP